MIKSPESLLSNLYEGLQDRRSPSDNILLPSQDDIPGHEVDQCSSQNMPRLQLQHSNGPK